MPTNLLKNKPRNLLKDKPKNLLKDKPKNLLAKKLPKRTIGERVARGLQMPGKGLVGDVPFLRRMLPEESKDVKPEGKIETMLYAGPKLARDFYAAGQIGGLGHLGKVALGGAAYSAATADTEDITEIGKAAVGGGALYGGIGGVFRYAPNLLSKGYNKFAPKIAKKVLGGIAKKLRISLPAATKITEANTRRLDNINSLTARGMAQADIVEKMIPKNHRDALFYIAQGAKVPKKWQTPELMKIMNDPAQVKALQELVPKVQKPLELIGKIAKHFDNDFNMVKQYLPLAYKNFDDIAKVGGTSFTTKAKFLMKRTVKSLDDAAEMGLIPETDVAKLMKAYYQTVPRALFNKRYFKNIKNIRGTNGEKLFATYRAGLKLGLKKKGWVLNDNPAVINAFNPVVGKTFKGRMIRGYQPVWINPEFAPEITAATQSRIKGEVIQAMEKINSTAKFTQLTASGFHPIAITETGIGMKTNMAKVMLDSIRAMKKGEYPILSNVGYHWAKRGVQVAAPSDIQRNVFFSIFSGGKDNIVKKGLRAAQKPLDFNAKYVFDYFIPNAKITTAEGLKSLYLGKKPYADLVKREGMRGVRKIEEMIAPIVNDTFGGQEMQKLLISPRMQQIAHWGLLSPDWFLSTLRQATMPFNTGGRSALENQLRGEVGREFWKTGGIVLFTVINQMNKAFTKFEYGEARNLWENAPDHKTHLFLGRNEATGEERYMRWGKQFRELIEWFINPIEKLKGKQAPLFRAALEQFYPYAYGNIAKSRGKGKIANIKARGLEAAKTFVPFSVGNIQRRGEIDPLMFAFPISSGMKYYKAIELFEKAYRTRNADRIAEVYEHAANNGLDAHRLLKIAESNVGYEEVGGFAKTKKIMKQLVKYPKDQWPKYIESLKLSDKEQKILRSMIKSRMKAEQLQKIGFQPERYELP